MVEMSANEIYAKGYADGYENGRMSKEPVFFSPCVDCNKKMDEVRKAYDYWKAKKIDIVTELEKIKREVNNIIYETDYDYSGKHIMNQTKTMVCTIIDKEIEELKGENNG